MSHQPQTPKYKIWLRDGRVWAQRSEAGRLRIQTFESLSAALAWAYEGDKASPLIAHGTINTHEPHRPLKSNA